MQPLRREFLAGAACFLGIGALPAASAQPGPIVASAPAECASGESEQFQAAVRAGDAAAMEKLLSQNASLLYSRDQHAVSSFMLACVARQPKAVDLLLSKGLVMDLHEAAAAGKADRVTEILKVDLQSMNARDI